jgi:hypothetical protein
MRSLNGKRGRFFRPGFTDFRRNQYTSAARPPFTKAPPQSGGVSRKPKLFG